MCNGNCGSYGNGGCNSGEGNYGNGGCNSCGGYWKTVKVWQPIQGQDAAIRCTDCRGNPLPGCVLTLQKCGKFYSACSGDNGRCCFKGICPGCYTLSQASAPAGYQTNCNRFTCCVYANGCCKINGVNSANFCLRCAKLPCSTPPVPGCGGSVDAEYGYNSGCGCNGAAALPADWGSWNSGGCGCGG
ncbi:MAG: prealbumin-like fold domain-containing protein [Oscillospiraceae bacterium]|jgi:hypothetical protein|nr:prealbumin-like fold domain-containing protein [Oscillospiraceae bacterium]